MNREWIGLHQRILIELIEALIEARISADQRCATLVSASAPIKAPISADQLVSALISVWISADQR